MVLLRTEILGLGIVFAGFCLISMAFKLLLVPCSIKTYIAPAISDYYKQEIYTRIHKLVYEHRPRASAQLLYAQLVLCCQAVKSVTIEQKPDRCATIRVQSLLPTMRIILCNTQELITNGYVLTDAYTLIPACYFDSSCLEQLPCLYVSSYGILNDLEQALKKQPLFLTQELFDQYKIIWHSAQKIVLELKKIPGWSIVANQELLTSKKRVYAEQLCSHIYKKGGTTRVIDIRFGNYLVCA